MRDLRPLPYRVLLLASVAGLAMGGGALAQTGPGPVVTLGSGQSLTTPPNVIATSNQAVLVRGAAASIANGGLIQATGANGVGIQVVSGGSVGTITNTGTVQASGNAILVGDTIGPAGSIGTLTNSGLIQSTGAAPAIQVNPGSSITAILNSAGTIQALGAGAAINVMGAVGTIGNSGLITSAGGPGIAVATTGSVGGIGNTGTISSILNAGQIVSSGTAIAMGAAGAVPGGITNTATGLIQGGPANGSGVAIDNSLSANKLTINNAGTVIGAIKLGPAGDTLNVTGAGSVTGAISGVGGSGDLINFNPTGTFVTGGAISNVDTINVNSSTVVVQNPVSGATAFNIAGGATAVMSANVQAATVTNAGMLNVGTNTPAITGNYVQTTSGVLGVAVTGAGTSGKLSVSGSATIQAGAGAVAVHVPVSTDPFGLVGNSWHVLTSAALTANAAATAASDNGGIAFGLSESATDLIITALTQTAQQIQVAAANDTQTIFAPLSNPTFSQRQAQQFFQAALAQVALSGNVALAHQLDVILTSLTPGQVLQFNNQLMPSTIGSSAVDLASALSSLGAGDSLIYDRLSTARLDTGQTGLAAGDSVGRGFSFWGQPFGAITSQGARDGFDGFDAGTYGVVLGADTVAAPNFRVGVALTLSNSNLSYNGSLSGNTGTIFTGELAVYGQYQLPNNFFIDGLLGAGYNHYNRHNLITALGLTLDSDNGGGQFTAKIGGGYDYKFMNGAVMTPYVSLQQFHFNFGSYTTSGGAVDDLDSHVSSSSSDLTQTRVGVRFADPLRQPDGSRLTPEVHAYWLHNFGASTLTTSYTTADFASPNTFTMVGPPMDRDAADIGLSATFARGAGWSFSGGYDFLGSSSATTHNFYLQVKLTF